MPLHKQNNNSQSGAPVDTTTPTGTTVVTRNSGGDVTKIETQGSAGTKTVDFIYNGSEVDYININNNSSRRRINFIRDGSGNIERINTVVN